MIKLIISLHKTKESDLPQVGCKALSLARMNQICLMVPPPQINGLHFSDNPELVVVLVVIFD